MLPETGGAVGQSGDRGGTTTGKDRRRDEQDKNAEAKLLAKVKKGGAGNWGKVPMPPMSTVPESDLKALIKWIMAGAN